jgi:ribonucleoside-diphosphate reductase alpha chain
VEDWKIGIDFPEWMGNVSLSTLSRGYTLPGETPRMMYTRVASTVAKILGKPELEAKFFDYMWKGWLCPASPILANCGTERGLPISCFSYDVPDSLDGIYTSYHEMAMLTKSGGGIGCFWGNVRGRGEKIKGNGTSEGVIPWLKILDSGILATSQGATRRGAAAAYLPIEHVDIEEFLNMRLPNGDVNRQCLNLHHGVCISDEFMLKVKNGDPKARELWKKILELRLKSGEPYLLFIDNVNNANPECYKKNNLKVKTSNLCMEIKLHTDEEHTFVCCLSSLNLAKFEEWQSTDLVETSIWFLDGIMSEFINKASKMPGFERAVRFAEKSRALGLGVLGYHTLLQIDGTPFDSLRAKILNRAIFSHIQEKSDKATKDLAKEYGEPEWCRGFNRRNSHCLAVAPTASNSIIAGQVSPGIEPISANIFAHKTAKGVFVVKNVQLTELLKSLDQDNDKVWMSVNSNGGSVQHLSFLTKEQKEIFLTAKEINQMAIVEQAAQRQKFIDQGQSLNIFVNANVDAKYFHQIHWKAWEQGVKGLYYCRSSSILKSDLGSREHERKDVKKNDPGCSSCEG